MRKKKKTSNSLDIWIVIAVLLAISVIFLMIVGIRYINDEQLETMADTQVNIIEPAPQTSAAEKETTTTSPAVPITVTETSSETTVETTETQATTTETTTSGTEVPASETSAATTSETDAPETTPIETSAAEAAVQTTAAGSDTYDISYFSNDLFIGDSIYTGLYLYGYFPKSQVFAAVGMGPNTASTVEIDGYTAAGRAKEMQPPHIFIMLGTNGLAYLDASFMADSMKTLVNGLHEASPESEICIISIPPVTYEHELGGNETMAKVNKYNSLLETAAGECGATYLDLCSRLQSDSGYFSSKYAEADGLHFLGAAYKKMLSFLQNSTQQ